MNDGAAVVVAGWIVPALLSLVVASTGAMYRGVAHIARQHEQIRDRMTSLELRTAQVQLTLDAITRVVVR